MVKKPMNKFILRNVDADDLINQTKGLRAVKERKREEKEKLNFLKFSKTHNFHLPDRPTKRQKLSDQIQRGFDLTKEQKDENET